MDGNLMSSHWMMTSLENQMRIEGGAETTKLENGIIPAGQGLRLLALENYIINKTMN